MADPTPLNPLPPFLRVRTFRERKGWTQARAARWAGVSERTWRRWERPGAIVRTSVLLAISGHSRRKRRPPATGGRSAP